MFPKGRRSEGTPWGVSLNLRHLGSHGCMVGEVIWAGSGCIFRIFDSLNSDLRHRFSCDVTFSFFTLWKLPFSVCVCICAVVLTTRAFRAAEHNILNRIIGTTYRYFWTWIFLTHRVLALGREGRGGDRYSLYWSTQKHIILFWHDNWKQRLLWQLINPYL